MRFQESIGARRVRADFSATKIEKFYLPAAFSGTILASKKSIFIQQKHAMIEKVTLHLVDGGRFVSENGSDCDAVNPKAMLLYAGAKCAGLTVMHILDKERIVPKRFEIALSGELSTATLQAISEFRSFHIVYNIECDTDSDQTKVGRAVKLAQEKYCGLMQMLRKIAPVTAEYAVVCTEPAIM